MIKGDTKYIYVSCESYDTVKAGGVFEDKYCVAKILSTQDKRLHGMNDVFYLPYFLNTGPKIHTKTPFIREFTNKDRLRLAAYIARNPAGHRSEFFKELKTLNDKVNGLGPANHTMVNVEMPPRDKTYELPKIYKKYKFGFAMESKDEEGYITEKIMNVYRGGAIPIYWGTSKVKDIFNIDSFIYINDYSSFKEAANEIIKISNDTNKLHAMQEAPIFKENMGNIDYSKYYDTPSPQWVIDIANKIKILLHQEGGNNSSKIINLFNTARLGDCMFVVVYLNTIRDYLKNNHIIVNFYIRDDHIEQIKDFIQPTNTNVNILSIGNVPPNSTDTWMGRYEKYKTLIASKTREEGMPLDKFQTIFFSDIAKNAGLPELNEFIFTDPSLLHRYNAINDSLKNLDILVINSSSISGDWPEANTKKDEWNNFIRRLSEKYKIVTTVKVDNILCTTDFNLKIKDIAAISTHVKNIIAVNTGPIVGLFNRYTFDNVNKWFIYSKHHTYSPNNFYYNKSFDEVIQLLEN
jgi:hypothetical protein